MIIAHSTPFFYTESHFDTNVATSWSLELTDMQTKNSPGLMSPSELSRQGVVSPSILERDQVSQTKHFVKEENILKTNQMPFMNISFAQKK